MTKKTKARTTTPLAVEARKALEALVAARGIIPAAQAIGAARGTIASAILGGNLHPGTALLIVSKLRQFELDAAAAEEVTHG